MAVAYLISGLRAREKRSRLASVEEQGHLEMLGKTELIDLVLALRAEIEALKHNGPRQAPRSPRTSRSPTRNRPAARPAKAPSSAAPPRPRRP